MLIHLHNLKLTSRVQNVMDIVLSLSASALFKVYTKGVKNPSECATYVTIQEFCKGYSEEMQIAYPLYVYSNSPILLSNTLSDLHIAKPLNENTPNTDIYGVTHEYVVPLYQLLVSDSWEFINYESTKAMILDLLDGAKLSYGNGFDLDNIIHYDSSKSVPFRHGFGEHKWSITLSYYRKIEVCS